MKTCLTALATVVVLAGCNNSPTESSPPTDSSPSRTISQALQATCKPLNSLAVAARSAVVDTMVVTRVPRGDLETLLYDSLGILVAHSQLQVPLYDNLNTKEVMVLWNGSNDTQPLPKGHYFQFWTLKDSLGSTLRQDSACIGLVTSAPVK